MMILMTNVPPAGWQKSLQPQCVELHPHICIVKQVFHWHRPKEEQIKLCCFRNNYQTWLKPQRPLNSELFENQSSNVLIMSPFKISSSRYFQYISKNKKNKNPTNITDRWKEGNTWHRYFNPHGSHFIWIYL